MNSFKNYFFLFILLFTLQTNLSAQSSQMVAPVDNTELETPTYDYEIVDLKTLGFPALIPAKKLGYQFVLLSGDGMTSKGLDKVYGANDLDRLPLFSDKCLESDNPQECSNEALNYYLSKNIDYPENAIEKDHDGMEKLFFVIDEYGKIEGNIKVISKDKPCVGCAKAAVEAVANMPKWIPGRIDGIAVKSKIILPVRFETLK